MVADTPEARRTPPVARLGRWNGERFVEVEAATIPASRLRVLVHGWTPGARRAEVIRNGLRAWELAMQVEPGGQPFEPWLVSLAQAITEHDRHAIVLAYSWVDDSATLRVPLAERRALGYTNLHGRLLAEAIDAAVAPDFTRDNGQVQLLGHSYGARVAAVAAAERADRGAPVAQLTTFDAPDAVMTRISGSHTELDRVLRRIPLGWGAGRTFVDNYVSGLGRRYVPLLERDEGGVAVATPAMIDVVLAPPVGQFSVRPRHVYPMAFYTRSPGTGVGFDWSPLSGRLSAPHMGCWEQRMPDDADLARGCTAAQ
jgi:pimeloyl-ACP methyl ester carboxylesterase